MRKRQTENRAPGPDPAVTWRKQSYQHIDRALRVKVGKPDRYKRPVNHGPFRFVRVLRTDLCVAYLIVSEVALIDKRRRRARLTKQSQQTVSEWHDTWGGDGSVRRARHREPEFPCSHRTTYGSLSLLHVCRSRRATTRPHRYSSLTHSLHAVRRQYSKNSSDNEVGQRRGREWGGGHRARSRTADAENKWCSQQQLLRWRCCMMNPGLDPQPRTHGVYRI